MLTISMLIKKFYKPHFHHLRCGTNLSVTNEILMKYRTFMVFFNLSAWQNLSKVLPIPTVNRLENYYELPGKYLSETYQEV